MAVTFGSQNPDNPLALARGWKLAGDLAWALGRELEVLGVRLTNLAHTIDRKAER